MQYLLGLIALLTGGLFFFRSKAQSAEAINENVKSKETVLKEDEAIASNTGRIEAEQKTVIDIQNSTQKELEKPQSNEDLAKFLNNFAARNKPKS